MKLDKIPSNQLLSLSFSLFFVFLFSLLLSSFSTAELLALAKYV